MQISLQEGEKLILELNANLMARRQVVGGTLILTDRRVIFEPRSLDLETGIIVIPLAQIAAIRAVNTLLLVPNGLLLQQENGKQYRFAVEKRKVLMEELDKKKNAAQTREKEKDGQEN